MPENTNGKFRPKKVNFAQISNTALQDANLSLKAKGLYSLIQSLITLPGEDCLLLWKIRKKCKEGDKAFDSAWKELKDTGYLKQYRIPNGKNGAFRYEYELLDIPDLSTPATINRNKDGEIIDRSVKENKKDHTLQKGGYGNSVPCDAAASNSDHIPHYGGNGKTPKHNGDHTPHLAPYGKSTPCFPDPVEKGGGIRNTLLSNTGFNHIPSDNTSISQSDRLTDFLREKIKNQIEYDYFEENFPEDLPGIDSILDCMVEMLSRPGTKINGTVQSREALEGCLSRMDSCTVRDFLDHMKNQDLSRIRNLSAYYNSSLINFIREQEIRLLNA